MEFGNERLHEKMELERARLELQTIKRHESFLLEKEKVNFATFTEDSKIMFQDARLLDYENAK